VEQGTEIGLGLFMCGEWVPWLVVTHNTVFQCIMLSWKNWRPLIKREHGPS